MAKGNQTIGQKYISLREAAKLCSYSQDYLSLRARQGKLKALKLGRNWVTTQEWLRQYERTNQVEIPVKEKVLFSKAGLKKKWRDLSIREKPIKSAKPNLGIGFFSGLNQIFIKIRSWLSNKQRSLMAGMDGFYNSLFGILAVLSRIARNQHFWRISIVSLCFLAIFAFTFNSQLHQFGISVLRNSSEIVYQGINSFHNYVSTSFFKAGDLAQKRAESLAESLIGAPQAVNQLADSLLGEFNRLDSKNKRLKLDLRFRISRIPVQMRQIAQETGFKFAALPDFNQFVYKQAIIYQSKIKDFNLDNLTKQTKLAANQALTNFGNFVFIELPDLAQDSFQKIVKSISNQISYLFDTGKKLAFYLSDISYSLPEKLSDTSQNWLNKAKSSFSFINIGREKISGWNSALMGKLTSFEFNFNPSSASVLGYFEDVLTTIKSKLGETYLAIVEFFDPVFSGRGVAVKEDDLVSGNKVDELEKDIINDIRSRFNEFRGESESARQNEQGVIVMPAEDDEGENRKKIEQLSQSFSDEVEINPNQDGRAGHIKPIFNQPHEQTYLYMMVPIKDD